MESALGSLPLGLEGCVLFFLFHWHLLAGLRFSDNFRTLTPNTFTTSKVTHSTVSLLHKDLVELPGKTIVELDLALWKDSKL